MSMKKYFNCWEANRDTHKNKLFLNKKWYNTKQDTYWKVIYGLCAWSFYIGFSIGLGPFESVESATLYSYL